MKKIALLIPLIILAFAACVDDYEPMRSYDNSKFTFNATIEPLASDDGSKVYLFNERWIYWEEGDEISIGSDITTETDNVYSAELMNASPGGNPEDFNGIFLTELPTGSSYFLGLHPHNPRNRIIGGGEGSRDFSATIYLPDTQGFRPTFLDHNGNPTDGDLTFARQVFPMVAWYGDPDGSSHQYNLDFHALAGIVRLNLFNISGNDKTLRTVTIRSREGWQLKGPFTVVNYKTEDPYLTGASSDLGKDSVLTVFCGEAGRPFGEGDLLTFYIPLPALGGRSVSTSYKLTMILTATDGSTFTKRFTVPIRRTGMTNMKAMGVGAWGGSNGSAGLSGCGTQSRPYKIYDTNDLKYLRDHYNGDRKINGVTVGEDTWFALMRSDLVINDTNWKSSIEQFVGHLIDLSHQSHPGITSRSKHPLFKSISSGGEVDGITLKCGSTLTEDVYAGLSPFCTTNSGRIANCVLTSEPNAGRNIQSVNSQLGGLCVHNFGTMEGCRNEARMEVLHDNHVAGICLVNEPGGMVKGCQVTSEMHAYVTGGAHVAGICLENEGIVQDCYFATSVTSNGDNDATWAGIVFTNKSTGTVEHCYLSATGGIYTTKSVAGIVYENIGGTVDYCWIAGPLSGINAGGIVYSLSGGKVINCFNQLNAMLTLTSTNGVVGGLVGTMSSGSIENSYVDEITIIRQHESATLGGIVGSATGGTINNCYDNENHHRFFGTNSGATIVHSYLVSGSQTATGLTIISEALATANTGTTGALVDLLNDDTEGAPALVDDGAKLWVQSGTMLPSLETYTLPNAKRRRR